MNMNDSSIIQDQIDGEQDDKGFTLIEILIAIVLVGILSAVAVVGISNLVSKGGNSACQASADSAKAAQAVYLASALKYPAAFANLTAGDAAVTGPPAVPAIPASLTLPSNVTATGLVATPTGGGWTLTMTAGTATTAATFTCS
jgi:type IV pilus assembly protein PilA